MDAAAQLALLTKAKLVFESDGTFLSFPVLEPLTYDPKRLDFVSGGADAAQRLRDLSEFSRVTNRIPRDVIAPQDDEYLWDLYDEVLQTAEVASGSMTAAEQTRLDAALALLYTRMPDGSRQDSTALSRYKGYRDAHIKAQEEYKNRQLTAEGSNDPGLTAQWAIDEPKFRQAIAEILREWETSGAKAAIESALQLEESFAARAPVLQWSEWKSSFDSAIDLQTDFNQMRFAPTAFSPYDVFDAGAWLRFTLTNEEILHLVKQAPPALASILGAGDSSAIESISFEYRSVSLTRSWLRPALFRARFWRLSADSDALNDGAIPPHGRCPSYSVALVFARNVIVRWRKRPADTPPILSPKQLMAVPAPVLARLAGPSRVALPRAAPKTSLASATVAPPSAAAVIPAPVVAAPAFAMAPRPTDAKLENSRAVSKKIIQPVFPAFKTQATGAVASLPPFEFEKAVPMPRPVQTEAPPTDEVMILAFVCKRLPRCPNPDPKLTW
jgi:hypothetical protein